MEIFQSRSRRFGQTKMLVQAIIPKIRSGETVFVAGKFYPDNIVKMLENENLRLLVEEVYNNPQPQPVYDNLFSPEPNIIGYIGADPYLTGHKIKLYE